MSQMSSNNLLDGIILEQNQAPTTGADFTLLGPSNPADWVCQEFYLPADFVRGAVTGEQIIPDLTGVHIKVNITANRADVAGVDYRVERYLIGTGWIIEGEGIAIVAEADGETWLQVPFATAIAIDENMLDDKWRFCILGRDGTTYHEPIEYDGKTAFLPGEEIAVDLRMGEPYALNQVDGTPAILLLSPEDGLVYLSAQQGVESIWVSRPNPLASSGSVRATQYDESPIQVSGQDTSLMFRLIGTVVDEGTDFLGNPYRSAIRRNTGEFVQSTYGEESDTYWFSKPNPSRFAVETLYFDVRDDDGNAQVIDQVYVDPVTPNVYFNVYYSDDGGPVTEVTAWEEKLWTHIPKQFKMVKQENHTLPKPILTKYLAIEFSHLQPRAYAPGFFQQPISYKKHPRWVLDYFLARTELDQFTSQGSGFIPRQIGITYDAIDLAYNYRLDDLSQEPDQIVIIDPSQRNRAIAELNTSDTSDVADSASLDQLKLVFAQFQRHPAFNSNVRYLLSDSIQTLVDNYPVELPDLLPPQYDVSALRNINRDAIIFEAGMPIMFFFLTCRHRYKEVTAQLSHERAYFAGVRQISFSRERYTVANDTNRYVETMGDDVNMARTDFVRIEGGGFAVY